MIVVDTGLVVVGATFLGLVGVICVLSRKLDAIFYFSQIVISIIYIYIDLKYINNTLLKSFASDVQHLPIATLVMWSINLLPMLGVVVYALLNLFWIVRSDPLGSANDSRME